MIITIGGPPGSGKTTEAKLLSKELGKDVFVIGEIFRSLAKERGCSLAEFGEIASKDHTIDMEIDKKTVEMAKSDDFILEGRLAGVMLQRNNIPAYKIWLDADIKTRTKRITKREGDDINEIGHRILERENCEKKRYEDIYGIRLDEREIYDLVIDTSNISAEDVVKIILNSI
ncbi:MAG: AAA family ATPase [Thermoplasmata archaeon]|nr:MAG: AAA family ATPase [Thermoplasmata archaeon]